MRTTQPGRSLLSAILFTGLLAGLMDGLAAIIQYTINGGKNPANIFKYIATAVFGKDAFTKGNSMVVWGVVFHLGIAMLFTAFFFLIYPKIKGFASNKILTAIVFGLFAWAVMNLLVVPLSKIHQAPFVLKKAAIAASILIVCIGFPVSFMANKYYLYRK
ncbi:MAG TPA: hypothetical protein VMZ03_14255 [Chitinophagaceae bacterium]|nr:hypothetical protein [Chitinophagaceae bacterium]